MKERIGFIDYGKSIAIFLVILGHLKISTQLYQFIYSFHMPFFFFISGYLFNNKFSFQDTLKKYFIKLIIPYLWFSIISFLTLPLLNIIIIDIINNKDFSFYQMLLVSVGVVYGSISSLETIWNAILWFLPCLFSVIILFKILNRIYLKLLIPILILIQFTIPFINATINPYLIYNRFPFGFDSALIGVLFFVIGYYSKNKFLIKNKYISLAMGIVSFLIVYYFSTNYKTSFDIANLKQGVFPLLTYIISILGIFGLMSFSNFLFLTFDKVNFVEKISNNTLYIFAFQFIIIWNLHRLEFIFPNIFYHLKYNIFIYSAIILCLTLIMKFFVKKIFFYIYKVSHLVVFTHI